MVENIYDHLNDKDDSETCICRLEKGGHWVELPPDLFARLSFECLDPAVVVQMLEQTKLPETPYSAEDHRVTGFSGESDLWL